MTIILSGPIGPFIVSAAAGISMCAVSNGGDEEAVGAVAEDRFEMAEPKNERITARNEKLREELERIWDDSSLINKSIIRTHPHTLKWYRLEAEKKGLDGIAPHMRMALEWADREPPLGEQEGTYLRPDLTEQMPLTQRIISAIVEAQAEAKGVAISELSVIAAYHGGNPMEVLLWTETGARVIAADMGVTAKRRLKRALGKLGHDKLPANLELVNPSFRRRPRGDIVAAGHPNTQFFVPVFRPWRGVEAYGRKDAIYIVQSDFFDAFVDPFMEDPSYDVLFGTGIGNNRYFYPSRFLARNRYTWLLIAARRW
jgi:hypothetical protein